jgi:hypothetical protein
MGKIRKPKEVEGKETLMVKKQKPGCMQSSGKPGITEQR